ncbi:lipid A biosynthesis lauroyl acyltransferase [Helicobacter burdigaliensis]|uniref:lipid A biosynthesis lauroyl acyltransferase n=1 Tax=Helicobacter burdigaliensis TaxID=2315334 RepID=UPI0018E57056|nr:lipid A biosynthesis lauroyl acyltransferase [Helicobacter burdigaliensis]
MQKIKRFFLFKFFNFLGYFFLYMPHFLRLGFAKSVAFFLYKLDKKRKNDILANLEFAYNGTLDIRTKQEIIRTNYLNLVYNFIDFFILGVSKKEYILKTSTIINKHFITDAINSKKPIIFVTAHFGNWEYATPIFTCHFDLPITAVARMTPYPLINEYLFKVRERFNIKILDKMGVAPSLIKAVRNKEILGIVSDQNTADKEGELVKFFGKDVRHTPIASMLARKFDGIILPCFVSYSKDYSSHIFTLYPPILPQKLEDTREEIHALTQLQSDVLEKAIRENPKEWLWFHRKFKNQYEEIYRRKYE